MEQRLVNTEHGAKGGCVLQQGVLLASQTLQSLVPEA